jgi:hypothetical protein
LVGLNHFTVPIATSVSPLKKLDQTNVIRQTNWWQLGGKKPSLLQYSDGCLPRKLADGLLKEVKRAHDEILANNQSALFWNPILQKITPSFLQRCEWAVLAADGFIRKTLRENMLAGLAESEQSSKIDSLCEILSNLNDTQNT